MNWGRYLFLAFFLGLNQMTPVRAEPLTFDEALKTILANNTQIKIAD